MRVGRCLFAICLLALVILASCSASDPTRSVVPQDALRVAGGFDISYEVTRPGTFYVVDRTSGKLLVTDRRDQGVFTMAPQDIQKLADALGLKLSAMQPIVYFVPQESASTRGSGD